MGYEFCLRVRKANVLFLSEALRWRSSISNLYTITYQTLKSAFCPCLHYRYNSLIPDIPVAPATVMESKRKSRCYGRPADQPNQPTALTTDGAVTRRAVRGDWSCLLPAQHGPSWQLTAPKSTAFHVTLFTASHVDNSGQLLLSIARGVGRR